MDQEFDVYSGALLVALTWGTESGRRGEEAEHNQNSRQARFSWNRELCSRVTLNVSSANVIKKLFVSGVAGVLGGVCFKG